MDIRIGNLSWKKKNPELKVNSFILIKGIIYFSNNFNRTYQRKWYWYNEDKIGNKRNLIYVENSRTIINQSF